MDRVILHSDLNNCFASIECLCDPTLRKYPVAVAGNVRERHGIILAKNELAKSFGVKTGEAIWQAREKCPRLVTVPPDFEKYMKFAQLAREIYLDYTDRVEPFGIDEAWLDISGTQRAEDGGVSVAQEIRRRMKEELGLTVSVGVSWNKIFAKMGSDLKKPDAVTVITRNNYRKLIWPLPAGDLLFVGRSTKKQLSRYGIDTVGKIAGAEVSLLQSLLGKTGVLFSAYARGEDCSPVETFDHSRVIKSISNSTTLPRDLLNEEDVRVVLCMLSDSVSSRLRGHGLMGDTLHIHMRNNALFSFERQLKLPRCTNLSEDLFSGAVALFRRSYNWAKPLRSIGIGVSGLGPESTPVQTSFFEDEARRAKAEAIDAAVDSIRGRFGKGAIFRALSASDPSLIAPSKSGTNILHPPGFLS